MLASYRERTSRVNRLITTDAGCAELLAKRPLTNPYIERPTWLAHQQLDAAAFAAYGWQPGMSDDALLAALLALNLERAEREAK